MWTLFLLPGVKLPLHKAACMPLQSLTASVQRSLAFITIISSERTGKKEGMRLHPCASWISTWELNLTGTVGTAHRPMPIYFNQQHRANNYHPWQQNSKNTRPWKLKTTSCNDNNFMHEICKMRQQGHVNIKWLPSWLLTWLAVPREKGCHYSVWKQADIKRAVGEKKMQIEQNAHIVKKKTHSHSHDMLKIY